MGTIHGSTEFGFGLERNSTSGKIQLAGEGLAGANEVLIDERVLTATTASITFSGIPQDYNHLRIELHLRTNIAGEGQEIWIGLNGDTTAGNYHYQNNWGLDGSSNVSEDANRNTAVATGATALADVFTENTLHIFNYTGSHYKFIETVCNHAQQAALVGFINRTTLWKNTAAITSISFEPNTADSFIAGSVVRLIGIKSGVPAQVGGMVKIASVTTAGGESSIDFSNISQKYDSLFLVTLLRTSHAVTDNNSNLYINGDTSNANYHLQENNGDNGSATGADYDSLNSLVPYTGSSAPSSAFASARITIPNYTSAAIKMAQCDAIVIRAVNDVVDQRRTLQWNGGSNTDPVSSLSLVPTSGTYAADCVAILYGIGGAASVENPVQWIPLIKQSPQHASTDYFDDSSLDGKWTELDNDSNTAITEDRNRLKITQVTKVGDGIAGIFQSAPAVAQYAVTAHLEAIGKVAGSAAAVNLFVAGDLSGSPTTAALVLLEKSFTTGLELSLNCLSFTDYNTPTTLHAALDKGTGLVRLGRIFVDNTANTYSFLVSPDGQSWMMLAEVTQAATTLTVDPTKIGLGVNNVNTGEDVVLLSHMFRIDETSDPFLSVGDFAGVPRSGNVGTDENAIHDNVSGEISAVTEKTTLVAADLLLIEDSAASNAKKKATLSSVVNIVLGSTYSLMSETLTLGTSNPLSLTDSLMTGKTAGGSIASAGIVGVVAGSFASSGAETGTGSGQAGLGSAAAAGQPYNVGDFPGQHYASCELRRADGDDVLLLDMLSTALVDVEAKVYAYLSYRSDLGADLKWRLWFYYRRASDGFETPFTPNVSLTNCKLWIPEVFTLSSLPVGAGLGRTVAGQSAAEIEYASASSIQGLASSASAGTSELVPRADHVHPFTAGADTTAIHDNVSAEISAVTAKAIPIAADYLLIEDSAASDAKKSTTFAGIWGARSETKTSTPYSVVSGDAGKIFDNEGAGAQINFNLPSAAAGLGPYTFINMDDDSLRINAAAGDTIRVAESVTPAAGYIEPTTPTNHGSCITLFAKDATQWIAINGFIGDWTVST